MKVLNNLIVAGDASAKNLSGTNTGDQDLSGLVPYTGATQDIDVNNKKITSLADGTNANDAVNKSQLDLVAHGGGSIGTGQVFLSNVDSDIATYKTLLYNVDVLATEFSAVVNNNTVSVKKFLYPSELDLTTFPSGNINHEFYARCSSASSTSYIIVKGFYRQTNGIEVEMYTKTSQDINSTTNVELVFEQTITMPITNIPVGSRFGIEVLVQTTRTTNTTVYFTVGDGLASWISLPITSSHDRLRRLGWIQSGHKLTPNKIASSDSNGNAGEIDLYSMMLEYSNAYYNGTSYWYNIGTIETNGTSFTITGGAIDSGKAKQKIVINGVSRIIATVASSTTGTLDYALSANVTGGTYAIYSEKFGLNSIGIEFIQIYDKYHNSKVFTYTDGYGVSIGNNIIAVGNILAGLSVYAGNGFRYSAYSVNNQDGFKSYDGKREYLYNLNNRRYSIALEDDFVSYQPTAFTTTGTVSVSGTTVTGVGTSFVALLANNSKIRFSNGEERQITGYTDATHVTIDRTTMGTVSGATFYIYLKRLFDDGTKLRTIDNNGVVGDLDRSINSITAVSSGATYTLLNNRINVLVGSKLLLGNHIFTLEAPTTGIANEIEVEFEIGATLATIAFNQTLSGTIPTWGINAKYQFVIIQQKDYNGVWRYTFKGGKVLGSLIVPTDGLIAYYPFNGNANDESGNNHNAIFINAVLTTDRNGIADKAYSFISSNSNKISLLDKTIVPLTDISISFWATNTNASAGSINRLFGNENHTNGENGLGLYFVSGIPSLIMRNNNTSYDTNWNTTITNNQWYFYTITISSIVGLKLYLNGVLKNSNVNAKSYTSANNTYLNIGCTGSNDMFYNGKIDEFRIYNGVLSQSEITALYGI